MRDVAIVLGAPAGREPALRVPAAQPGRSVAVGDGKGGAMQQEPGGGSEQKIRRVGQNDRPAGGRTGLGPCDVCTCVDPPRGWAGHRGRRLSARAAVALLLRGKRGCAVGLARGHAGTRAACVIGGRQLTRPASQVYTVRKFVMLNEPVTPRLIGCPVAISASVLTARAPARPAKVSESAHSCASRLRGFREATCSFLLSFLPSAPRTGRAARWVQCVRGK